MGEPSGSDDMISVQGLKKSFGKSQVLKGIDLHMQRGTTTVVLGGSGSGKTVLMKHIIGLLKPDEGQVIVDGENISTMGRAELNVFRERMGMVFQGAALFDSMTVGDNVAFPLREHTKMTESEIRDRVKEKLAVVDLHDVEQKFPAELSGGMRKRVGLARAIIRDPKIVLYDEPTTGLDPLTTESVDQMILMAREKLGVTSVVISHDIGSAFHIADHIAVINQGHIVEEIARAVHPPVSRHLVWQSLGSDAREFLLDPHSRRTRGRCLGGRVRPRALLHRQLQPVVEQELCRLCRLR
jgi:phospholipid/cholesterol/gamma-HCH transport system ATP-binding protein